MNSARSLIPAALLLALGACKSYPASAEASHREQFHQISSELEAGGTFYMVTNQSDEMKNTVAQMRSFARMMKDEPAAAALYDGLAGFYESSGATTLIGSGVSTVERADGLQRTRLVAAYGQSRPEIFKLSPAGQPAWDLGGRLPADTVAAFGFALDIRKALELACASTPQLKERIERFYVECEQQGCPADLKALASSDPVCLAFGITLDAKQTLELPEVGPIPLPGAVTVIRVDAAKRDALKLFLKEIAEPAQLKHLVSEQRESWTAPELAPGVSPSIVLQGDLLVIACRQSQVEAALAGKDGLMQSSEWCCLAQGLPQRGDSFIFVSERIGNEVKGRLASVLSREQAAPQEVIDTLEQHFRSSRFSLLAISTQKEGSASLHITSTHGPVSLGAVAVGGIMSAMLLPALGKVREKARVAKLNKDPIHKSKNQLKQLGLCMRMYFSDGTSIRFPEDLKTMFDDESLLTSPIHQGRRFTVADLAAGRADYVLVNTERQWAEINSPDIAVMFEKPNFHGEKLKGVLVLFGDGHVDTVAGSFKSVEEVIEALRLKK
ncbi:MAG: hypothetical protein RL095_3841 [Verrucomicrobiota bacterium]|jgi:hypothetical protein